MNGNSTNNGTVSGQDLTVTVPSAISISNNSSVTLVVSSIDNPTSNGTYTLQAKTSVEDSFVSSNGYTVTDASPVTVIPAGFSIDNDTVNSVPNFTFQFTIGIELTTEVSTIRLKFPSGTYIPATVQTTDIQINTVNAFSVATNTLSRTVTITVPNTIAAAATITVDVLSNSGISAPAQPGNYVYQIRTSEQPTDADTPAQTFVASVTTSISNLSVSVTPQSSIDPVNWIWSFETGSRGALEAGVGEIYLDFDQSVFTEPTIDPNFVKVNDENSQSVSVSGSIMTIVIPSTVTVGNNAAISIVITEAAGIKVDPNLDSGSANLENTPERKSKSASNQTPTLTGTNNYSASTSSESSAESSESNPLPVELLSVFITTDSRTGFPVMTWSTATEKENYGFIIERSDVNNTVFNSIGFVEGNGTITSQSDYRFSDNSLSKAGTYSYRLSQQDFDGTVAQLQVVEFTFEKPNKTDLLPNYPNPFNPSTTINYSLAKPGKVEVFVYNLLGQRVVELVNARQEPGKYSVQFEATGLASGVYFLMLQTDGLTLTRKITLVK